MKLYQGNLSPFASRVRMQVYAKGLDGKGIEICAAPGGSGSAEFKALNPTGKIPALERPPFSSYNSYKLLEKYDLKLPKGEAKDKKLPDGGKLALMFKEVSRGKKKDDPTKFVVSATIEKADGKQFLPGLDVNALKGEYFFIAGQKYNGGILVIGVKIN